MRFKGGVGKERCCPERDNARDQRPLDGPVADADLATMTKALGHPARVRILRMLSSLGSCVCGELVPEVGLAQSTVSQHLKVLKEAGLVQGTVDGPRVCYCANIKNLGRLKALIGSL